MTLSPALRRYLAFQLRLAEIFLCGSLVLALVDAIVHRAPVLLTLALTLALGLALAIALWRPTSARSSRPVVRALGLAGAGTLLATTTGMALRLVVAFPTT